MILDNILKDITLREFENDEFVIWVFEIAMVSVGVALRRMIFWRVEMWVLSIVVLEMTKSSEIEREMKFAVEEIVVSSTDVSRKIKELACSTEIYEATAEHYLNRVFAISTS